MLSARAVLLLLCFSNCVSAQKANVYVTSRLFHPIYSLDTLSTIDLVMQFQPASIEWMYCDDESRLSLLKKFDVNYSLSINPQVPDSGEYTTVNTRIINIQGAPFVAPWMKDWNQKNKYWGCVNNPMFAKLFYLKAKRFADLGAYAIFVDDALFNVQLSFYKDQFGCFCDYCLKEFKTYLSSIGRSDLIDEKKASLIQKLELELTKIPDNNLSADRLQSISLAKVYLEFQNYSVVKFIAEWKRKLLEVYPTLKIETNNYNGQWTSIYKQFDVGIAELQQKNLKPSLLDSLYRKADSINKRQLFTLVSNNDVLQSYFVIYNILFNRDFFVPWDLFVPTNDNNAGRYYADLSYIKQIIDFFANKVEVDRSDLVKGISIDSTKYLCKTVMQNNSNDVYVVLLSHEPTNPASIEFKVSDYNVKSVFPILKEATGFKAYSANSKVYVSASPIQVYQLNYK